MDKAFMLAAIKKAERGVRKGNSPFGSCIVKGNRIIATEHNTVWQASDATSHAEIHTIRAACKRLKTIDLSGCTIYSTTEPCPMCFAAIHWSKISHIIYGTAIADVKKLGFSELTISNKEMRTKGGSKVTINGGFMRTECLKLLGFWKSRGGKAY